MAGVKGRSGPRKQPKAVHKMRGTDRKDRHAGGVDAPPAQGLLEPPKCMKLTRAEKTVWKEIVALLREVPDLLAKVDVIALASFCEAIVEANEARAEIKKEGATCVSDKGCPYQHPAVGRKNKALERIRYWVARFAMSPSDRAGLDVAASGAIGNDNPFEAFLRIQGVN